tara:strand:- start:98 stop:631 length:534 start_codon:yes stop_codon:yes gene_type:complete
MFGGDEVIWASLIIISIGNSFHRMGPSFERSRFGFPLILLGLTCLLLLPDELSEGGTELNESILRSVSIALPLLLGAMLILRNSPTYGERRMLGLVTGWGLVSVSWAVLFTESKVFSIMGVTSGIFALLGILLGLISVIIGSYIAERSSGLRNESEPLSNEEGMLVRTILERRLGRD